jgi:hypothetical protein
MQINCCVHTGMQTSVRIRPKASHFPSVSIAVISSFLASCGGDSSSAAEAIPADTARLECQVVDGSSGNAVADASVNYQAGSTAYTTQTNADGTCRLDMPAAAVAGVQYPAASVAKPGYEPQTILCASLQGGSACSQTVQLIPLAANVSVPVGGDVVMHLGDDQFEGAANSQFQKSTDGAELAFRIADWAEQAKAAGVTKATVYLDAKGWQSHICDNQITLAGDVGTAALPGGVSPAEGYWGGGRQVPFVFAVEQIGTLNAELRITSGACNGTTDLDDFEINRIRVEFS